MPEGDTIFRAAATLRKWIAGREITAAETKVRGLGIDRVVGTTVDEVTPRAKHLLIRFSNGLTLHTHMRMTGSWHLYREGEQWQRPPWQAKVVLRSGDRVAVCFNAPVVELLTASDERSHGPLNSLGPDVLGALDTDEVLRRAATRPADQPIGELLLDQQVVSGIGNIYRCEALFADRLDPWTAHSALEPAALVHVVETAARLMRANAGPSGEIGRRFEAKAGGPSVYKRAGRPCRRCGGTVRAARMGNPPRTVYWCPTCQGRPARDRAEIPLQP